MIPRRLIQAFMALATVFVFGVAGYMYLEGWNLFDASYMTLITIATVGYGETHPLSHMGRAFTMVLIVGGIGVLTYGLGAATAFLVEGELQQLLRRRKMEKAADRMKDHYVVCGADRTGHVIVEELHKTGRPFVVVDKNPETVKTWQAQGLVALEGDATHDTTLIKAGIKHAKGMITVLPTDKDNLFVVLTARGLNPSLRIVSRMLEDESESKLRRAGADAVVSPNHIGGLRLVSVLVRPAVVSFLDTMLREKDQTYRVENIEIKSGSAGIGKTLEQFKVPERYGLIVVAIQRPDGSYTFNPPHQYQINAGDMIVVMGQVENVHKFQAAV